MLTQTSIYAIQAMAFLAQNDLSRLYLSQEIARQTSLPAHFLAKILGTLAARGILRSIRGRRGGFQLSRAPGEITLLEVVTPFERYLNNPPCILGNAACPGSPPCPLHSGWQGVLDRMTGFLQSTTLADVRDAAPLFGAGAPDAQ